MEDMTIYVKEAIHELNQEKIKLRIKRHGLHLQD